MVDLEGIKLLIGSIDVEQKSAKRDENVTGQMSVYALSVLRLLSVHIVTMSFFKSVDLAMAHVVIFVG